jgi:hypothetical protein
MLTFEKLTNKKRFFLILFVFFLLIYHIPWASAVLKKDFKQLENKHNKIPGLTYWTGAMMNDQNSMYYEGECVNQRIFFTGIPSTTGDFHSLTFFHEATKGGIHAYDFLTAYNQSNNPLDYDPCGESWQDSGNAAICAALRAGDNYTLAAVPDDPFISKDGSTQDRIDEYETIYGNRYIKIYGNQPITSASFYSITHTDSGGNPLAPGGDTSDSDIRYNVTWTSASTSILIEIGAHLGISGNFSNNPLAWGIGLGSGSISGGPWHFKLTYLDDNSLGQQDNQIASAGIEEIQLDVDVGPNNTLCTKPGTTVIYNHYVNNTSDSGSELFKLNLTSSNGFLLELWDYTGTDKIGNDTQGDGIWDWYNSTYDTDSDGIPDTGYLGFNTSIDYQLHVVIPVTTVLDTVEYTTFKATSRSNSTVYDTATDTTNIEYWESYCDPSRVIVCNLFNSSYNTVYMMAQGLNAGDYRIRYYDGSGTLVQTEDYLGFPGGHLNSTLYFPDYQGIATEGTWTVNITDIGGSEERFVCRDTFQVDVSAIPEFPLGILILIPPIIGIYLYFRKSIGIGELVKR